MIRLTHQFDIITPCFCGGAEPDQRAEMRAASIRGQLRWWFRVLGGFKSLAPQKVSEQEAMIFGATAGDIGTAGKLTVRVTDTAIKSNVMDGQELGHANFSSSAFLTFPIQSREKQGAVTDYAGKGVITNGSFSLVFLWRGSAHIKPRSIRLSWAPWNGSSFLERHDHINRFPYPLQFTWIDHPASTPRNLDEKRHLKTRRMVEILPGARTHRPEQRRTQQSLF